ncbi:hypothetical protein ASF99_03360 [Exiguobacterium sp. Leaf187]|uniref:Lipoprotein n=1 Tax=Exiguobacterium indicum TaxID=296995 RepID=A0ABU8EE40_9BACL|nr:MULTISPECIES: hypothetical protein [Exiguobacterium]MCQ4090250.1 hypothetical protein [Exiguobacterium sp. LL15]AHA29803.1 hypothetical protein U719_08745 [Exiguobacterium sp. MH3]KNH35870.1 hypothetical protein ACS74_08360 [Exiguobacterium acetylicum]KQS18936.1 hypothetical protein ASF99_03360 [Exiguobacterium sp. Leaf187]OAI89770.1 hypothetical protein AYO36_06355 [Exiguobacterium sp. KKBO11]
MKHLFSILLSASLLFTGCYCTLDERTDEPHFKSRARSISSYHTFDIEYAKGLRKEQVSNRTVTVTDSNGERMQTEIEVLDGKEIRIKPPRTGYKKGRRYIIHIRDSIDARKQVHTNTIRERTFTVDR